MNEPIRRELFDIYTRMVEDFDSLNDIIRREVGGHEGEVAKAYWLGNIDVGLRAASYVTQGPTFKDFLVKSGIIDGETEEYIDEDEEDE